MTMKVEHYATDEVSPDKPHKQKCKCGRWFYDLRIHVECATKGCHPEQYHSENSDTQNRIDNLRENNWA